METRSVCHKVCLFTPQITPVPKYTAWWQRQTCVNDFTKVALDSAAARIEPAISKQVQRRNHYTTDSLQSETLQQKVISTVTAILTL